MLSILLTNIVFAGRTGTEVAALELAQALRARGHRAAIFSPTLGRTALTARALGIPVTSKIEAIGFTPDIIHGSHNGALALAMVRFPGCPAVFVCHDTASPYDEPLLDDCVGAYVAVDAACRDRLVMDGVDPSEVTVIPNGVDLAQFTLKPAWQERPQTALLIVKQRTDHVDLVARACSRAGIALEVVGPGAGKVVDDLPERCRRADIVFAHSRSAIEAVAVGAAVIVIDEFGYGGWFRRDQVLDWPDTRLSQRILAPLPGEDELTATILQYDRNEAEAAATVLRGRVDLSLVVQEWEAVYARAIGVAADRTNAAPRPAGEPRKTSRPGALAAFLSRYVPRVDQSSELQDSEGRLRAQQRTLEHYFELLRSLPTGGISSIAFHPGALGQVLLSDGWHQPETWGVWSADERAGLWLPETIIARWGFALRVGCTRYMPHGVPGDPHRTVAVFTGPTLLTTWQFSPDRPSGPPHKLIEIPESVRPRPGRSILLSFRIDRPIAPVEAGESTDRRPLGLRLTALEQASA